MHPYNFGAVGSNLTKLFQVRCREAGMIKWVQFLVGLPPLEFGRAKTVQNWCDFAQLRTSITNISKTDEDIDKRKRSGSTTITPTFDEKNLVKFGPRTKKL